MRTHKSVLFAVPNLQHLITLTVSRLGSGPDLLDGKTGFTFSLQLGVRWKYFPCFLSSFFYCLCIHSALFLMFCLLPCVLSILYKCFIQIVSFSPSPMLEALDLFMLCLFVKTLIFNRVLLCSPDWSGTQGSPVSVSCMLGPQAYTTTPSSLRLFDMSSILWHSSFSMVVLRVSAIWNFS